jgi:Ca2+-binding RTX toxin-like protein
MQRMSAMVNNLTFTRQSAEGADIVIFGINQSIFDANGSVLALTYLPANSAGNRRYDIFMAPSGYADFEVTFAHEILHSVGLVDASAVFTGVEDTARYTLVSSNSHPGYTGSRFATELQLYDIAALQSIYGRSGTYGAGDTLINDFDESPSHDRIFSIWDADGNDTIDAHALSNTVLIDLRPGYFSTIGPEANVTLTVGTNPTVENPGHLNVSIAYGAYIENAIGTGANDIIIGNLLGNKLEGGGGSDVIYAEGLNSVHETGETVNYYRQVSTNAPYSEAAPTAVDNFINDPTLQADHLLGGGGDDYLHGGRGNDLIEGGADDDYMMGGAGNDIFWGGVKDNDQGAADGIDRVDYSSAPSRISITFNGDSETPSLTVGDGQGGTDTLHSIEKIVGTAQIDYLYYSGSIPEDYDLTIDFAGGNDDVTNGGVSVTGLRIVIGPDNNGTLSDYDGTPSGPGGHINLLNVHSQIIGSAYDDWVSDAASGEKRIDGGDGDDVITILGAGQAKLMGGDGDDILTGGDGSDVLMGGEGDNRLFGGGGTDLLISDAVTNTSGEEVLDGGEGSDLLIARNMRDNVILRGGGGNDLIDARESSGVILEFGAGDGHDTIEGEGYVGPAPAFGEFNFDWRFGVAGIRFTGLDLDDVTIYWDLTITDEDYSPGALRWDYAGIGDLAIVVNDTGASIFLDNFAGAFNTFGHHDPFVGTTYLYMFGLPTLYFDDGEFEIGEGGTNVDIAIGGVGQYDVARADYAAGVEDSIGNDEGTPGDDDLSGGIGDDALDGGDGDDSFSASGGEDLIDGGAGSDTLYLFGARLEFLITRDPATGDVTLEDQVGTEGRITVKSVEKIYFAGDNQDFEPGDLVGFWGTPGDDSLVQGNARDNMIHGLAGADLLRGLAGNDVLDGGEGADTMQGGAGNDVYMVDQAGDVVAEAYNAGIDEIRTSLGSYSLASVSNVENLTGLSAAGQALTGNSLANVLTGGAGADTLNGGAGSDTAAWGWSTAGVAVDILNSMLSGDAAGDTLISIENLAGGSGADALSGTGAANILDGGAGADVLTGRGGNDIYYVDDDGDAVVELAGGGSDEVRTALGYYSLAYAENVETLRYVGGDAFAGWGGEGNDLLFGGAGGDTLAGGAGIDTLYGGAGGDVLYGEDDGDVLDGGAGGDYLVGGIGNDVYLIDDADDQIEEFEGEGIDLVYSALAEYALPDEVENLTANGADGQFLTGNALANIILGGTYGDALAGAGGNDELRGQTGADFLDGGEGDDLLVGGADADDLTGGAGADIFRFAAWDSNVGTADTIADFVSGEDKIDLAQIDAGFWTPGQQHFSFIGSDAFSATAGELRYVFNGTDTVIKGDWDGDGAADFVLFLSGQITPLATDFIL